MADEPDSPPISFNRQIAALDVGETVAVARRVRREEAHDISSVKGKMRNSVNPAVSKAKRKHGTDYCTDTGEFLTQDGHVVVAVAVTRIG
ncbi:hypothetical protein [Sphingomonas phage Carli]|nr:hypothetical protein [Sphingomonas phage Carli]